MEVDFSEDGNSQAFTGPGWYKPERNGRWTQGYNSVLKLPRVAGASVYRCTVLLTPYVDPERHPLQRLIISVNGTDVFDTALSKGGKCEFQFPAGLLGDDATFTLALRCPNAVVPSSIRKGADMRHLGVLVGLLSLVPDVPESQTAPISAEPHVPVGETATGPRPRTLAVVTMAYNEADLLPLWLRYYGSQVGLEHCYVVDHGSDDGSSEAAREANRIRIPRSPLDEERRADFISKFCNSLLSWYDHVIYCDVDEIIVADPQEYDGLAEYCEKCAKDVVTPVGMNLIHRLRHEAPLDLDRPILPQRQWLVPAASMCKPALTRVPIKWGPGFHSSDRPLEFDRLFTFHLAYVDADLAMRRQQKRRSTPLAMKVKDHHHKASDDHVMRWMAAWSRLPPVYDNDLTTECAYRNDFISKVKSTFVADDDRPFKIDLNIWGQQMWRVPARFLDRF